MGGVENGKRGAAIGGNAGAAAIASRNEATSGELMKALNSSTEGSVMVPVVSARGGRRQGGKHVGPAQPLAFAPAPTTPQHTLRLSLTVQIGLGLEQGAAARGGDRGGGRQGEQGHGQKARHFVRKGRCWAA